MRVLFRSERAADEPVSEWSVACQCRGDLPARAVCVPTTVYALLSSAFSSKHGATSRYGWTIEGQDENPRSNFCAPKKTPAIGCFYDGRGDRIRTFHFLLPKPALYQPELRPVRSSSRRIDVRSDPPGQHYLGW